MDLKLKIKILKVVVVQEEVMIINHRVVKLVELTGMMKIVLSKSPTQKKKTKCNNILNKFNIEHTGITGFKKKIRDNFLKFMAE